MDWALYGQLSVMMLLQFAVLGAWVPALGAHALGALRLSRKQAAWACAAFPLACIVSPLIGGQMADRCVATQWLLAASGILGGIVLLAAARQRSFAGLFGLMGLYGLLYAPTIPLAFSLMMRHVPEEQVGRIRAWGAVGWAAAALGLAAWRRARKHAGAASDALSLAGILCLALGAFCLLLPHTPPARSEAPFALLRALQLLARPDFLVFLAISFAIATQLQFHHAPTEAFLEDIGFTGRNVPAVMAVAQVAEAAVLAVALGWSVRTLGYQWTLAIGLIAWPARYVVFALTRPVWLVVASLAFHGLGCALFVTAGQMYGARVASPDARACVQALITVATLGLGSFLGTWFAGATMEFFREDGWFRWRPIFLVPCILTVACVIGFLALFKG